MVDKHKLYNAIKNIIDFHENGTVKNISDVRTGVEYSFEDVATGGEMDEISFHLWEVLQQIHYIGKN